MPALQGEEAGGGAVISSEGRIPDWPPPADEPIGIERARAYFAWISENVPPLIATAEQMLRERWGDSGKIRTSSWRMHQFAAQRLMAGRDSMYLGCVSAPKPGGSWVYVDIRITRDGYLVISQGW